jgi:hypothetical protein
LLAALLAVPACNAWDLAPRIVRRDLPVMPAAAALDYRPLPGMAHAALPIFDQERGVFTGDGRVWLKGSPTTRRATIAGRDEAVALDPPCFTAVVTAPPGARTVVFEVDGEPDRSVQVTVPDAAVLNGKAPLRALFFGDFQPFDIQGEVVTVNPGEPIAGPGLDVGTLIAIRRLFAATAAGELAAFRAPSFACGIGDQIYVEGDYHEYDRLGERHPMSAWTVEAQPRPRVPLQQLPEFLDRCYRGHWSFPEFERALAAVPSVMTWDDHDVRDGWGSHGDEHVFRDSFFRVFREAFVAHQVARGPRLMTPDLLRIDAPLWQSFVANGVPVFVLDLRTCRNIAAPTVLGDEQWQALRQWFAGLDVARSRHYVLVSSMPVFYRIAKAANLAASFSDEVRDDLLDTWTSGPNQPEWRRLVEQIVQAGARGLRGVVVSGDYHVNALCRITAANGDGDGEPTVLAYEIMAAGLASDGYGDWKQRVARKGFLLETPIDVVGARLSTEFAFAEATPSFLGLEVDGERVAASIFLATGKGCAQLRVPLSWDTAPERLSVLLQQGREPIVLPRR